MPGNTYVLRNPNAGFLSVIEPFQNNNIVRKGNKFVFSNGTELSAICPHNKCLLNYKKDAQKFVCPCHNSKFNLKGECLQGPACPKNLKITN